MVRPLSGASASESGQMPQREVVDDRVLVIVDKRSGQAVRVGREDGQDEQAADEGDDPARRVGGGWRGRIGGREMRRTHHAMAWK